MTVWSAWSHFPSLCHQVRKGMTTNALPTIWIKQLQLRGFHVRRHYNGPWKHQQKASKLLQMLSQFSSFENCVYSGFQILIKNVFGTTMTGKRGSTGTTYRVGCPSKFLNDFVDKSKDFVKLFRIKYVPQTQLRVLHDATKSCTHVREAITRWGTIESMVAAQLDYKPHSQVLVAKCDIAYGKIPQKKNGKSCSKRSQRPTSWKT